MAKVAGLDVVLTVNGKNIPIDAELLSRIAGDLPDRDLYKEAYAELAKSASFEVRENVASKDNLDEKTVAILAEDPVEEVVNNLISSSDASKCIEKDVLSKIINRSAKLAAEVAGNIGKFENIDDAKICDILAASADPIVRKNLAESGYAPKKILRNLLKDEDPGVSAAAKENLA